MDAEATRSFLPPLLFLLPILGAILTVPLQRISARARDLGLAVVCAAVAALAIVLAALSLANETRLNSACARNG